MLDYLARRAQQHVSSIVYLTVSSQRASVDALSMRSPAFPLLSASGCRSTRLLSRESSFPLQSALLLNLELSVEHCDSYWLTAIF